MHLSDLHLGKHINEMSMLEDQEHILTEIIKIIDSEAPDGIIIAGDVYDKSVPPTEAVELFDDFLVSLASRKKQVFVISGNHDSPERIAFGSRIMESGGIHISPVYNGNIKPVCLNDEYGTVNVYMLPFIKPAHVRRFHEEAFESYTDAVRIAVADMKIDTRDRNLLVTHQFVTGAFRSESENISLGGSDNVDACVFDEFDYVALGHIHRPQNIGSDRIRYCGTPLKYSFSEANDKKSVTVIEMLEKGKVTVRSVPLVPKREMTELKGAYSELTAKDFYDGTTYREDYVHITLTDEEDIPDAIGKLRVIYRNIMKLDYDNKRTRQNSVIGSAENAEHRSPLDLFAEFYEKQNNQPMSDEQSAFMKELIEKVWEDER